MNQISYGQDKAEYFAAEALNKSSIDKILDCPAAYKYAPETPATRNMELGTVTHAMVLQPETVGDICHVCEHDARTKAGKEEKEAATAAGKILLKREEFDLCQAAAKAAREHPVGSRLLGLPGNPEVSVYWDMEIRDGAIVPCKARVDYLAEMPDGSHIAVDLKTTTSGSVNPDDLPRHIYRFHYERQAAWYLKGLTAVGLVCRQFVFIFVDMKAPHLVTAVTLSDLAIDHGWKDCLRAAKQWQFCTEQDDWPGYSDQIVELDLPTWAYANTGAIYD